jgi:hypothetical protein
MPNIRFEPPRRVTVKQNTKFVNVMSFVFHPLVVRVDNISVYDIELCDKEIKPGAIGLDSRHYSFKLPKKGSMLMPFPFDANELWAYAVDGDVEIRVMFADSTDPATLTKITAGMGSGGGGETTDRTPVFDEITITPVELIEWTP